jgi:hypothetical protein
MICSKQGTAEKPQNAEVLSLNNDNFMILKLYLCQCIVVCFQKHVNTHTCLLSSWINESPVQVNFCASWKWYQLHVYRMCILGIQQHARTCTHTHTDRHTHTQTHTRTDTHTQTYTDTHTHTQRQTHTHTHRHTQTHTRRQHTNTHTHTRRL